MENASKYWETADIHRLAHKWNYDDRLPYDIMALIPHLIGSKEVWDAACGTGRIVRALTNIFPKTSFVETDINIWNIEKGIYPPVRTCDTVLLLGVICYLDDDELCKLLHDCKDKKVIIRVGCDNDVHINRYIDEMDGHYEVLYRTQDRVMGLMKKTHNVPLVTTVYPVPFDDNGTQMLFVGYPC